VVIKTINVTAEVVALTSHSSHHQIVKAENFRENV